MRTFNNIVTSIKYILKTRSKPPLLGRWNIIHGEDALRRADLTNEDHCGVCSEMRENYIRQSKKNKHFDKK